MKKLWFMLAMCVCVWASCSDGGSEDPANPTPKPEEVVTPEITISSDILTNGLAFDATQSEKSVSFSTNVDWTLSIASTTGGSTWCKASATSGSKGSANVKFTVDEHTDYDDRSVSVTIKAGTASKTFTITQKCADALLITTDKYEVAQDGATIEVEVKANIDYQVAISETAKSWISEVQSKSRALTTHKHSFTIAASEETEKREGEITFKSGDKVETVKVYQAGGPIVLLTKDEYTVSDQGETISVDIKSNVEYSVKMPEVDWITEESASRAMSSHTLKYIISPNEDYDSRSAEIVFYDKNSNVTDTLKVIQAQKDAIVISQKNYEVKAEGETIEVKLSTNVDIEMQKPSSATWITQTTSRALNEKCIYLKVYENTGENDRNAEIVFKDKNSDLSEKVTITQKCPTPAGYTDGVLTIKTAGTMKSLLGSDYLNITELKIDGPINGDDIYYLRKMLGGGNFSKADWGKLTTLDLSEASIVVGGEWYYDNYYTKNDIIGEYMFYNCSNLTSIVLPNSVTSIGNSAFSYCESLTSIEIPNSVTSIGNSAFLYCESLTSIETPNSMTSIGNSVFSYCESLTSIVLPNSVTSIGNYAFRGCSSLTSIEIPNSVTSIGEEAFKGCSSLTSIKIPNNVTSISDDAFCFCI